MSAVGKKGTFDPATRKGEHGVIVRHTAVMGGPTRGEPVHYSHEEPAPKC
jgi:hypothetical protein